MRQHLAQQIGHGRIADQMIVVEHQDEVVRKAGDLVDERGAQQVKRRLPRGLNRPDVASQAPGKIVRRPAMKYRKKRPRSLSRSSREYPGCRLARRRIVPGRDTLDPGTHQHGFTIAGAGADQRQWFQRALAEPFKQARPRQKLRETRGRCSFVWSKSHINYGNFKRSARCERDSMPPAMFRALKPFCNRMRVA